MAGRSGSPSAAFVTIVPLSADGTDLFAAIAAISCAGVRAGRAGAAWALVSTDPAATTPATATAPNGTAHRTWRENLGVVLMSHLARCRTGPNRMTASGTEYSLLPLPPG